MTEHQGIPEGEPMVEVYDIETDEMVLAPKSVADRAELLKQAFFASVPDGVTPRWDVGDPALFEAAKEAALELKSAMIRPPPIEPDRKWERKTETARQYLRRHRDARKRGPRET